MSATDLLYVLALQRTKGIGDINAKKLIAHFGSAKNIFKEKRRNLERITGIGRQLSGQLLDAENLKAAEKELNYLLKNEIDVCYYEDTNYPKRLKHCIDAPILVFIKGNIKLHQKRIISIVGTRHMTNYGRDICRKLIKELAEFDPIIVSGFAYGIDICAHRAALENNLQTIAVLAHGFDHVYPAIHRIYVEQILSKGGFMTDFWHDEPIIRENFIKRNRIVAGISEATIVIESAQKGGALITAEMANSYNREVFAVPGKITDLNSSGCNEFIKDNKAVLLRSAQQLSTALNWGKKNELKPIQRQLFVKLEESEKDIYNYLKKEGPELLDLIALECKKSVQETATTLFSMEMKGLINPLPGNRYEAV